MAERGQRTKLLIGDLEAQVSLIKVAGDVKAPRFESRLVEVESGQIVEPEPSPVIRTAEELAATPAHADAPFGGDAVPQVLGESSPAGPKLYSDGMEGEIQTRRVRGTFSEAGTFVDLTETLEAIDEHVKLPGIVIEAAITSRAVPRERVRDASYVAPMDEVAAKVATLLYRSLRRQDHALVVRWSKRTNQALGIIVASASHRCLMLLEVEWSERLREPSQRLREATNMDVSESEQESADNFVRSLWARAVQLDEFKDERRALQADLLESVKEGRTFALSTRASAEQDMFARAIGPADGS